MKNKRSSRAARLFLLVTAVVFALLGVSALSYRADALDLLFYGNAVMTVVGVALVLVSVVVFGYTIRFWNNFKD